MTTTTPPPPDGRITTQRDGHVLLDRHRPAQEAQRLLAADAGAAGRGHDDAGEERRRLGRADLRRGCELHGRVWNSTRSSPISTRRTRSIPTAPIDPLSLRAPVRTKPVVCAVQGICFTLGIELMLSTDIVIAADTCRFAQIEVKRGIMPTGGATVRMVERAGWGNAQRYLLTGDEFGAQEALRLGFVQEVVPAGQEEGRALEIAPNASPSRRRWPCAPRWRRRASTVDQGPNAAIREFAAQQAQAARERGQQGRPSLVRGAADGRVPGQVIRDMSFLRYGGNST